MKALLPVLLCVALAAGCATNGSARKPRGRESVRAGQHVRADDLGVQVKLRRDGTILLYNRPVSRGRLLQRLKDDENCDRGARAVILEGEPGTRPDELLSMREFLVRNRIPRVIVALPAETSAEAAPGPALPVR